MESTRALEVGLGVQFAAEVDEGFAVVEALLVEERGRRGPGSALERVEEQAGDDDGGDQTPDAQAGQAGVDHSAVSAMTPK